VILGRPLDQTAIQRLAEDLCLSVYAFRPEALASRPVARAAFAEIAGADATTVRVLDAATVAGYGVVYDLQALPALLIEAQTPRDIYGQGLHISNAFTVLLLVAGGAFLLAVALLQRVTVISRLEHLSREVDAVAVADDCAKAVSLAGTDELAALARNINRMLERLAASRRALADSEARYRRLFDAVPVGLFSTTPDGQRLDGNQAMMEVLGCATRESYLKGKSVGAYVRAQDRQHWHDLIRTHGSVRDCEVLLQRHDGALVWGLLSVTAVRDETGQVVAHEGSFVDITARKAAEDALRQSEERFQQVAQSVADWVWEIDPSGLYTYASRAVERILGYRAEEVVRTKWFRDLLAPAAADARNRVLLEAMERRERIRSQVCAGVHRDGRVVLLETSATPVLDATGGFLGYRGAGTDVTERRQAEERQAQLEMHLQQQQRMAAVGMLASGVAHQISNPVFGIMNYALLVSEGIEEGHPLREYAGEIVRECRRVADTVSSLLAFSQPEEKGTSLARVADIVGALLSLVQAAVCRDQIALQVAVPEDLPMVRCRSAQIQHVLMSLLTNAREALNARYPGHDPDKVIRVTAGVVAKDGRTWVRTTVEDHGPGIPVADRSRVFEPFFTTKDRATSAGLGLAVSHGIVKAAGGLLHFESEVDRYTRFHVDLPACADLDEGDAAATPAGASGSSA
jgi:PAS domain S-box-containing protein